MGKEDKDSERVSAVQLVVGKWKEAKKKGEKEEKRRRRRRRRKRRR